MGKKTTLHFYKTGDFRKQELALDAMSAAGWQAVRPGRLFQTYTSDSSKAYIHRFSVCESRAGSAEEITFLSENELAGWQCAARKGKWLLFRKPADEAQPEEQLPDGRTPIAALFTRKIKPLETFRMWMIVLGSLLMLVGYWTDILPLLYSFAAPLLAALIITLKIKYMQEGLKH